MPLERLPALDGLRAVAVIAVLLFHGEFGWASGGYLGVSVFFTLSGFLITLRLLEEHERTGRIDLVSFAGRRVRRLLPAATVLVFGVVALSALGEFDQVANLRRELLGAVSQLTNWAQLTAGHSYAEVFAVGASPVEHLWSLAIEEQFYLVWPLVFALGWARRSARVQTWLTGAVLAGLAVLPWVVAQVWGSDAAYLSTPARLSELFAGAALAMLSHRRTLPSWLGWGTPVALVVLVFLVVTTPSGGGWAYRGGLPLFAALSVALVAGLQVEGPARSVLSTRPLVAVGTISYGLYLFHWPIFLLADDHRAGFDDGVLFLAKVAASLLVAVASYLLVERPVRRSHASARVSLAAGAVALVAVAVCAAAVAPGTKPSFGTVASSDRTAVRIPPVEAGVPVGDLVDADRPARILVVGDSTGEVMGAGLVEWAVQNPGLAQVEPLAIAGCGLVAGGRFGSFADEQREVCDRRMHEDLPELYATLQPDVVVIIISVVDAWARQWDDGPKLRATDPGYRRRIERDYRGFFDAAVAAGVPHIVWVRPARDEIEGKAADPSFDDGGQRLIQDTVEAAVARHPGLVEVLDFRRWFEQTPYLGDRAARPDGLHLDSLVATAIATDWLGPRLLEIAHR